MMWISTVFLLVTLGISNSAMVFRGNGNDDMWAIKIATGSGLFIFELDPYLVLYSKKPNIQKWVASKDSPEVLIAG